MDESKDPGIRISQIFLGKALFEHSDDPTLTPARTKAGEHQINIIVNAAATEDERAGIITVLVQTTPENKGSYRFVVEMVGLVDREPGAENMSIATYLTGPATATLFPFVREALANITGRGRFGPVWLKPFNLNAVQQEGAPDVIRAEAE